jgi:enoyl-CoA hydratase
VSDPIRDLSSLPPMSVQTSREGNVLVITLDRVPKRNALNPDITAGLDAALNLLEDDPALWCGVLTGGTEVFSAGADLTCGPGEPTPRGGLVGIITRTRSKPLIAAVEGFALGGGPEIVLCCDLVVASKTATFGFPEVKRGLMPDFGGAFRIPRVLPANVARELLLTGESGRDPCGATWVRQRSDGAGAGPHRRPGVGRTCLLQRRPWPYASPSPR